MISSILKKLTRKKLPKEISVKALPGINKKSFSMYFGGGEIWFEHLDGMHSYTDEVKRKFINDTKNVTKPSAPSLIAVNLDETVVNEEIIDLITDTYIKNTVYIHKVVFVGLDRHSQKLMIQAFKKREGEYQFAVDYINDFEKAKEWLAGK
jgi:hypothetical protein